MAAVQAMTGSGGWPMSVFLTPDGRPFYGGTYFPDTPRHGLPSFRQVLDGRRPGVARAARRRSSGRARRLVAALGDAARLERPTAAPTSAAVCRTGRSLDAAVAALERAFDRVNGGWGGAPKFPQPMTIEFLLRRAAAGGDGRAAGDGPPDARRHGRRRHPRPARRRLPPLRDRRDLARAALRADALRQRPARPGLPPRLAAHRRPALPRTSRSGRSTTWPASCSRPTGRSPRARTPTPRAWRAATFVVDRRGDPARRSARGRAELFMRGLRRDRRRQLGGHARSCAGSASDAELAAMLSALGRRGRPPARRGPRRSSWPSARRRPQPARDDKALAGWNGLAIAAFADAVRALVRPGTRPTAIRPTATAASPRPPRRPSSPTSAGPDGLPPPVLEGRARLGGRRPRGPRLPRRGAARALRGDVRRALVRRRARARRHDPRRLPRPGRRLLRHGRRPRDARHPAEGPPGQRGPVGQRDGGDRPPPARRPDRRRRLPIRRRARDRARRPASSGATRRGSPNGWSRSTSRWPTSSRSRSSATRPTRRPTGSSAPTRTGFRPHLVVACRADPGASAIELLGSRFQLDGRPTAFVCRDFACRQPVHEPEALAAQIVGEAAR